MVFSVAMVKFSSLPSGSTTTNSNSTVGTLGSVSSPSGAGVVAGSSTEGLVAAGSVAAGEEGSSGLLATQAVMEKISTRLRITAKIFFILNSPCFMVLPDIPHRQRGRVKIKNCYSSYYLPSILRALKSAGALQKNCDDPKTIAAVFLHIHRPHKRQGRKAPFKQFS